MKKTLLMLLLTICSTMEAQKINWIPFDWVGESIEGRYFDKLLITIPVSLDKLPHRFNMQFDLGAVNTVVYGNSFKAFLAKYPDLNAKIDTSLKFRIQSQTNYMFKNVAFKLGRVSFGNRNIGYFKNFGDDIAADSVNTKSEKHIGTIAPDLFLNKILIIDYPNKRIAVIATLPKQFAKVAFQPFKIEDGRIKIPLNINNKTEDLMFDTGSSLFSIITTEASANQISKAPAVDSLKISSWGEYYMVYGQKITSVIKFGNKILEPSVVFYDKQHRTDQFNKVEKIWGVTGNAYFMKNMVIIDYKNKRFGVN
jgi:hypothetical protein